MKITTTKICAGNYYLHTEGVEIGTIASGEHVNGTTGWLVSLHGHDTEHYYTKRGALEDLRERFASFTPEDRGDFWSAINWYLYAYTADGFKREPIRKNFSRSPMKKNP
jgi:hypothetical protein